MLVVQRKLPAEIPDSDSDIIADTCKLWAVVLLDAKISAAIGKPFCLFDSLPPYRKVNEIRNSRRDERNFSPVLRLYRTIAKGCSSSASSNFRPRHAKLITEKEPLS